MSSRRVIAAVTATTLLFAVVGARLTFEIGGEMPLTARGAPSAFGDRWLPPDTTLGRPLDSTHGAAVQAVALDTLLRLAREHAGGEVAAYCVGTLADSTISPAPPPLLETLRAGNRRVVGADRCRLHLETASVDRPGLWPRRAWALWAAIPREAGPDRAVIDVGYHAGPLEGAGWRCHLSRRGGGWVVDSTERRWAS